MPRTITLEEAKEAIENDIQKVIDTIMAGYPIKPYVAVTPEQLEYDHKRQGSVRACKIIGLQLPFILSHLDNVETEK